MDINKARGWLWDCPWYDSLVVLWDGAFQHGVGGGCVFDIIWGIIALDTSTMVTKD